MIEFLTEAWTQKEETFTVMYRLIFRLWEQVCCNSCLELARKANKVNSEKAKKRGKMRSKRKGSVGEWLCWKREMKENAFLVREKLRGFWKSRHRTQIPHPFGIYQLDIVKIRARWKSSYPTTRMTWFVAVFDKSINSVLICAPPKGRLG